MSIEHLIFPSGDLGTNSALLWCSRTHEGILVDPGGEPQEILDLMLEQGVALRGIVLTHAHVDNLRALPEIREATTADVYLHAADRILWESIDQQCEELGFPSLELPEIDEWLQAKTPIVFGRCQVEILELPGHTPGSCGLWLPELNLALCGDTCFAIGIGRTDLWHSQPDAHESSLDLLASLPAKATIIPGHGPAFRPNDIEKIRLRICPYI